GQNIPDTDGFYLNCKDGDAAVPNRFVLGAIAPGTYQLSVIAPGSARHLTEPFKVEPGMRPVKVELEKGAYVYASIVVPRNARGASEIRLFRDGEDVTERYASGDSG